VNAAALEGKIQHLPTAGAVDNVCLRDLCGEGHLLRFPRKSVQPKIADDERGSSRAASRNNNDGIKSANALDAGEAFDGKLGLDKKFGKTVDNGRWRHWDGAVSSAADHGRHRD